MKCNKLTAILLFLFSQVFFWTSCSKDDSKKEYGFSRIYMPQAINKSAGVDNNFPVPSGSDSSTYNYVVDATAKKVKVILGASVSGPGTAAYAVDIAVDNDTIQQLLDNGVLDAAVYKLMPATMYTLPERLEVSQGAKGGTFYLSLDIDQLKSADYAGKFLVLAVRLTNPTTYELNSSISSTIIVVDVNTLVIGPAVNITWQHIKNPGGPFVAAAMSPGGRWGTLKDWTANDAAKSHGGYGGFATDAGGTMNMESGWGSPQILNGKIYQTITLPAGTYSYNHGAPWDWQGTKDVAYVVIAPGLDTLPDYNDIPGNTDIWYKTFQEGEIRFTLPAPTEVTIGVVVNYIQDQQGFKTKSVALYNYPKAL